MNPPEEFPDPAPDTEMPDWITSQYSIKLNLEPHAETEDFSQRYIGAADPFDDSHIVNIYPTGSLGRNSLGSG